MTPAEASPVVPHGPIGRFLGHVTGTWALLGGLTLVALMVVESLSVTARVLSTTTLGTMFKIKGLAGDTELVEVGCAAAISAFLAHCQLMRANVFVDFFTAWLPQRVRSFLDLAANVLFMALAAALAWQTGKHALEKFAYGDTTTALRIPEAIPYTVMTISLALLVLATLYTVARSAAEISSGRLIGPQPQGGH